MPNKSSIKDKCVKYVEYIETNGLIDHFFDPSRPAKYSIDNYVHTYLLFQKSGLSYELFFELASFFTSTGISNVPKKTALFAFKSKMADLNIHQDIHNKYVEDNNLITKNCIIDSSTIFNKNNSTLAHSFNYKNKKSIKNSFITNSEGFPLYVSVDSGNVNDAKLGLNLIETNIDQLKNHNVTILADKGYDSSIIRTLLDDNECDSIIPKNIRRGDNPIIKEIKKECKDAIKIKRTKLMQKQKRLRTKINSNKLKKRMNNINHISLK